MSGNVSRGIVCTYGEQSSLLPDMWEENWGEKREKWRQGEPTARERKNEEGRANG